MRCREVQQKVKAVADAGDGDGEPAAKRSKHSATETVTVKKVGLLQRMYW